MATCKIFIVAVLFAAISVSCAGAFDQPLHDANLGGRKLFESAETAIVMKPRNTPALPAVGSAPGTETHWEVKTDQPSSFTITSVIEDKLIVHCHSSQQDEPNTVLSPLIPYTINFQEDLTANIPWICDFSVVGDLATQSFPVWTHDGTPYLSDCDECFWKVQSDGFWISKTIEGIYVNVHPWIVNV